jgi:cellulose synthase/poly-beta-1,6-N-acetylglucosamine synthase-like glycosyltransferase
MNSPLITVLIAAYNEEKNLPNCLDSIVSQDFPKDKYEILVVDNNSSDKTVEIAKKYGARVVTESRQGNTFAVSKGMKSALGEVIAMLDADTLAGKNWLKQIEVAFSNKDVVGATGNADINSGSKLMDYLSPKVYGGFLRFNFLVGKPHLTGFNLIVRRKTLEEIGGINEEFTMSPDVDLGLRLSKKGRVIYLKNLKVITSFRRWQDNPFKTFKTYAIGYIWSIWLRKPPPTAQNVIR